jgi:hypothetical protein
MLLSASMVGIIWAANAVADSPRLMGTYGFTRTVTCVVSASGFDPNDFHASGPSFGESFAETGIRTFNRDGTGTQSSMNLDIIDPALSPGASSSHFTSPFTYVINGDGTWAIPGGGSISGTVDGGPRAGQTFTITNIAPAIGWISRNAKTLTLTTVTPAIESITYYSGGVPVSTFYRICNRSSTLISLQDED